MSVEKVLPFPFYWKPRQSGVSLKFPGLENIAQVPGNRGVVCLNHDSQKAVSASLSVLKLSGAKLLGPEAGKSAFKKFCCFHITPNQDKERLV